MKDDLKTEISRNVANKMRHYAKELLFGTLEEQFGLLRRYAVEILRTNPGSTVMIALYEQVFKGIYICFNACKAGFRIGCRKVIGVDGCHLRGFFGGIMLTAKENTDTWRWFLKYLQEDIEIGNGRGWTLMTDRQKGLQNVCEELFLEAEHRFNVRHMYTNFFSARYKSKTLKDFLWRAAKATTVAEFRYWMQKIRDVSEEAYGWLIKRHPQETKTREDEMTRRWQVDCSRETYVVDLEEWTCACRKWELAGIPCMHAIAVIRDCRNEPEDFVDNCYMVETYMNIYNNIMNPINDKMLWPEVDAPTIIHPKWNVPQRGKKQKK
ncbi:uncharacterized protein LOC111389653 [Olea europaea var. sylvestris]|uniref:uncharacterized protein LOC111389653 n=1 Tax=Olea europaea var. sylvestris TaxID=158386 RepID=UPI000C1D2089|nr:uncharacterized protein LOC111389653 [Olea europaea var. sylvestris]